MDGMNDSVWLVGSLWEWCSVYTYTRKYIIFLKKCGTRAVEGRIGTELARRMEGVVVK